MSVFTVHEPPRRRDRSDTDPERFEFVREGFHFWAFLLGPLWMLWHRVWLWLAVYLLALAAILIGLPTVGAGSGVQSIAMILLAILIGLEAPALRRWALARRGWITVGIVAAFDRDDAERRFFDSWIGPSDSLLATRHEVAPVLHAPVQYSQSPVVGLFPEPGAPR